MSTIANLEFLPDGQMDLSTAERRAAGAECVLRAIASVPTAYAMLGHAYCCREMARLAQTFLNSLTSQRSEGQDP